MSLEDFSREVTGKPPKDRSMLDRAMFTDEDGCSYDQQVMVGRLPLGLALAFGGGLLLVGWASGDLAWTVLVSRIESIVALF